MNANEGTYQFVVKCRNYKPINLTLKELRIKSYIYVIKLETFLINDLNSQQ